MHYAAIILSVTDNIVLNSTVVYMLDIQPITSKKVLGKILSLFLD